MQTSNAELKGNLSKLNILSAKEVDVAGGKTAIVIFVPYKQARGFQAIQKRLVHELEKKFSGSHVVFIAQRTIFGDSYTRSQNTKGPRPRSRTLTSVHEAILEDLVYPVDIVGKRTRVRVDGSRLLKVYLDPKVRGRGWWLHNGAVVNASGEGLALLGPMPGCMLPEGVPPCCSVYP